MMKNVALRKVIKMLIATVAAIMLTIVTMGVLFATAETSEDSNEFTVKQENLSITSGLPPAQPLMAILQSIDTGSSSATVGNGDRITYTIVITNRASISATDIIIQDILPLDTLSSIECLGMITCTPIIQTIPAGNQTITVPRRITWAIESLVGNGGTATVSFSGQVSCQPVGASFSNRALVTYQQNGDKFSPAVPLETFVGESSGASLVSRDPIWCADDRGMNSFDWGDFDRDGDLDLALGFHDNIIIYSNENGQLSELQSISRENHNLRWADLDKDGNLELITIGEHTTPGRFYIYSNDFGQPQVVDSTSGFLNYLDIVDYDGDDDLDLAIVDFDTNSHIRLYNNDNGQFTLANSSKVDIPSSSPMAWGDYDNDGDIDFAIRTFSSPNYYIRVFNNQNGNFSATESITITPEFTNSIRNFAWGDHTGDGFLDLAVSASNKVGVYRNPRFFCTPPCNSNWNFIAILDAQDIVDSRGVLDWADFNGDKRLDLAISNVPLRIYDGNNLTSELIELPEGLTEGFFFSFFGQVFGPFYSLPGLRGLDVDKDGDLELGVGNFYGKSLLLDNKSSTLNQTLTTFKSPLGQDNWSASDVAWGDIDQDGDLDLLFGAGIIGQQEALDHKLYENDFSNDVLFSHLQAESFGNNFGPSDIAFGNLDGDGQLEIALGSVQGKTELYEDGSPPVKLSWSPDLPPTTSTNVVAWADSDDDEDLDLLVANGEIIALFTNQNGDLGTIPVWSSNEITTAHQVAWSYLGDPENNHDFYPDFAIAGLGQSTQVYRNDEDNTFSVIWTSDVASDTRSVAWGDYDLDGDVDLAVGNYDGKNFIYANQSGTISSNPVWESDEASQTTSLVWGDWDNDGDLDLAVGNDGEPDQVYANLRPLNTQLALRWESAQSHETTGLAWGDQDNDGDLDLAMSSVGRNGVYENIYVSPAHLADNDFAQFMPLLNNPSYLSVERPGKTAAADFFASSEILLGPVPRVATITYRLYDPDGSRSNSDLNEVGDQIAGTFFEYSLDGGGTWQEAQPVEGWPGPQTETRRLGQEATFLWDIVEDEAISDNARFRITIIQGRYHNGLFQRASTSAVSPLFRVRGLSCVWPLGPEIKAPESAKIGEPIDFQGVIGQGSGVMTFTWDFGDNKPGVTTQGQFVQHTFDANNTYTVTLTINGVPCPITEPISTTKQIKIGTGVPDKLVYLPLILKSGGAPTTITEPSGSILTLQTIPGAPSQVTGLRGDSQLDTGTTTLSWQPNPPEEGVRTYAIYRAATASPTFRRIAEVPGDVTSYTDESSGCGQMYLITAANDSGESLPSVASYFTLPCR